MHRVTPIKRDRQTDTRMDKLNPISLHFTGDNQGFMGFETDWIPFTLTDMYKSIWPFWLIYFTFFFINYFEQHFWIINFCLIQKNMSVQNIKNGISWICKKKLTWLFPHLWHRLRRLNKYIFAMNLLIWGEGI